MTSHLDTWNSDFADMDEEIAAPSEFRGFPFKLKTNYHAMIKNASVTRSQRGDVQVQLDLSLLDGFQGAEVATHREWLQLPKQVSDATLDRKVVLTITKTRRDNIGGILGALEPNLYRPFASIDDNGRKLDDNGRELSRDELDQATVDANRAVLRYCDELHGMEGQQIASWEGLNIVIVKTPNKKNADYPYTNVRSHSDPKLETYLG